MQASRLKYLAEAFRIPILVTNQVTTYIGDGGSGGGSGGHLTAALGTLWAHAVNTRLVLESVQGEGGRGLPGGLAARLAGQSVQCDAERVCWHQPWPGLPAWLCTFWC